METGDLPQAAAEGTDGEAAQRSHAPAASVTMT
jgi:hypothetical protein